MNLLTSTKRAARFAARHALGKTRYEKIQFKRHTGYELDLENPKSFNEKLTARKLNKEFVDALILQDKYEIRSMVEERVGERYLTDLYDLTADPKQLDTGKYPGRFVIKSTNSCGPNSIYIHDGSRPAIQDEIVSIATRIATRHRRLFENFYFYSNEWWYGEIPTRIMVEEFLSDGNGVVPLDYKFFVFHGRVEYIQIDSGRFVHHTRAIYDRDWKRVSARIGYPDSPDIDRPENLDEMIEVAQAIGGNYGFLRVDLYSLSRSVIKFGEVTVAPSLGHSRIEPRAFDFHLGDLWKFDNQSGM